MCAQAAYEKAKAGSGKLHLMGLVSDGGVHSHQEHLWEILKGAKEAGVPRTVVHCVMDGRDTPPKSGAGYMKLLVDKMKELEYGEVSTVVGRYWAMDRDKRWERVQLAFDVICRDQGEGDVVADPVAEIETRYGADETDEFLKPFSCLADGGVAVSAFCLPPSLSLSHCSYWPMTSSSTSPMPTAVLWRACGTQRERQSTAADGWCTWGAGVTGRRHVRVLQLPLRPHARVR